MDQETIKNQLADKSCEVRSIPFGEVRMNEDDGRIEGYASVFNSLSEDLGGFVEIVRPGAFAKTINDGDTRALWNHNDSYVLGRKSAGTLSLMEDARGLKVSIDPPDTQWASDLKTSIKRGDVSGMSFGFRTVRDNWRGDKAGLLRELLEIELFEVSPVTFPAYPETELQARALNVFRKLTPDVIERLENEFIKNPDDDCDTPAGDARHLSQQDQTAPSAAGPHADVMKVKTVKHLKTRLKLIERIKDHES